ncbi:MAG: beta-propeller domain-containing protein [Actinomycetota bacterium]
MGVIGVAALAATACSADDNEPVASDSTTARTAATASSAGSSTSQATAPAVEPDPPTTVGRPSLGQPIGFASLQFFGDCPALLDHMQTIAAERVTPWGLDGGYSRGFPEMVEDMDFDMSAEADTQLTAPQTSSDDAGAGYSGTNVQEVGVDEGDVVETDGEHLFVASPNGGVRIVDVATADVVSAVDVPEGDQQLLLDGNRLAVITSSWSGVSDTVVSLYDVSDTAAPALIGRHHLEGRVVATRAIDGIARIVVATSFGQRLPFVTPGEFGYDDERALARNREIITESDVSEWLPRRFVESTNGEFGSMEPALDCAAVGAPGAFSGLGVTWIASVNLNSDDAPQGAAGVVADGSMVYASPTSLYVANQQWDPIPLDDVAADQAQPTEPPGPPPTVIHRFDLDTDGGASYVASGNVPGRLLNQFAMSEHNGDLRVATTVEDWNTGTSESIVTVLRPTDGELREISAIGGLGRGEQIFAVRFMGDVGYVVTFRQIDPLYVIDLSDPTSPVLQGELKIPGYSAYLHPVGEGLLLGVGQDATDEGRPLGTQLSLFDVSEPTDPQRIDTLSIGGWSDVEWDHRAFLYWPADGTIAIPASPGWNDCGPGQTCLADSLRGAGGTVVAQLDGTELSARGVIDGDTSTNCWNPPLRTVAIDDELAAVSPTAVVFADRASLDVRDKARWGDAEQYGCYWYE